jgi:GTP-binding protein EngB required for normal cell division
MVIVKRMKMENDNNFRVYKIALVGASGVGKTSLVRRVGGRPFEPRYFPTNGYRTYVVDIPGARLLIKEYSGKERYQTVYDTDFDAVLAVTTASKNDTRVAQEMLQKLHGLPYCMVENKSDVKVTNHYMCCSAKTSQNLAEPFINLVALLSA